MEELQAIFTASCDGTRRRRVSVAAGAGSCRAGEARVVCRRAGPVRCD